MPRFGVGGLVYLNTKGDFQNLGIRIKLKVLSASFFMCENHPVHPKEREKNLT